MPEFTLTIELGNDAMQTDVDLADTIHKVAREVADGWSDGDVRDANGNTVGHFVRERADNQRKDER